ncbi:helix-turn-helix domain-containing protein [Kribbella sp. NPDC051620]|uniref:helix-turn-helix domain-containing protein n=1 Tax=Kribbella sp. NPDC051620 TaxID=3364120 RepID=UPI0037A9211D
MKPAGVIHHAFALLRALNDGPQPVGVSELAQRAGLPKTTAHRLLLQLEAEGAVERHGRQWGTGAALHGLARRTGPPPAFVDFLHPRLQMLAEGTGASLFLSVASAGTVQVVDQFNGSQLIDRVPAQTSSQPLQHPGSVIWKALREGLATTERGAVHPAVSCIGTVLGLPSGETAVLSLALPSDRAIDRFKPALDRCASAIGREALKISRRQYWAAWSPQVAGDRLRAGK